MRQDLERFSNLEHSSELISRWVGLAEAGRYDHQVAMKTVRLDQHHIDKIAKYGEIREIVEDLDSQVVIASAIHYMGEKYTLGHMGLLINSVFKFVKVGKAIDSSVMPEICQMIISDFGLWLTFADLKLCLKFGITNRFGELYDRIDTQVIFRWLEEYRTMRMNESEQLRREALRKQRAEDKGVPMPPEIKEKMEALDQKLKRERESKEYEFKPTLSKNIEHLRTD